MSRCGSLTFACVLAVVLAGCSGGGGGGKKKGPPPPDNVVATAGTSEITITWDPVDGATFYNIYWDTGAGVTPESGNPILGVTSPYLHFGRPDGATTFYVVTTTKGNREGKESAEALAMPLAAPTVVVATAFEDTVNVSWNSVPGATAYNLYWSTSPGVDRLSGTRIPGVASPHAHTGRTVGQTYYYVVTATNSIGGGAESVESVEALGRPIGVPTITATAGYRRATVDWSLTADATYYNLYWSTATPVTKMTASIIPRATPPLVHRGIDNGTPVYYALAAVKTGPVGAESALSPEVSATPGIFGALDGTFGGPGWVTHDPTAGWDEATDAVLDVSGRILVTGYSTGAGGDRDMALWRFEADGTLDIGISHHDAAGGAGDDEGRGIALDPAGRILVAGYSENAGGGTDMALWRVDPHGTLDTTFAAQGWMVHPDAVGEAVAGDAAGNSIVVGSSFNGTDDDLTVWRVGFDGALDTAFGGQGWMVHDDAAGGGGDDRGEDVTLDVLGRVLVTGSSQSLGGDDDMVVWRIRTDGTLDTTFGSQGWVTEDGAAGGSGDDAGYAIVPDAASRILVAGTSADVAGDPDMTLWRYNPSGVLDGTFNGQGWVVHRDAAGGDGPDVGYAMALDVSDRILVAGGSINAAGDEDLSVWRFNTNGGLDTTVIHNNAAGGDDLDSGRGLALDGASGKFIVAGTSVNAALFGDATVWRYATDGTLDRSFGGAGYVVHGGAAGGAGPDSGMAIDLDGVGRIVVAGSSENPAINADMAIWRFDGNGTLDITLGGQGYVVHDGAAGGGLGDEALGGVIDGSGRILLCGSSVNGSGDRDLAVWRFLQDGTLDGSFGLSGFVTHDGATVAGPDESGEAMALDSFGRILVAGVAGDALVDTDMVVWRFDDLGNLDPLFNATGWVTHDDAAGGGAQDAGRGLAVDGLDRSVVTGDSLNLAGDADMVIWVIDDTGALDGSFGGPGWVIHDDAAGGMGSDRGHAIRMDASGKFVVTGESDAGADTEMVVWRYDDTGNLDGAFGGQGWIVDGGPGDDRGTGLILDGLGRILVTGSRDSGVDLDMAIWRMDDTGVLDGTFGGQGWIVHDGAAGGGGEERGAGIALDSLGRVLVAGHGYNSTGDPDAVIWRYR